MNKGIIALAFVAASYAGAAQAQNRYSCYPTDRGCCSDGSTYDTGSYNRKNKFCETTVTHPANGDIKTETASNDDQGGSTTSTSGGTRSSSQTRAARTEAGNGTSTTATSATQQQTQPQPQPQPAPVQPVIQGNANARIQTP